MSVSSICGVILISENVQALADFYSHGLGVEFEREDHGGLDIHYGVDIGNTHFGIHPPSNFKGHGPSSATPIAFAVSSLAGHLAKFTEKAHPLSPNRTTKGLVWSSPAQIQPEIYLNS